MDLSVQTESSAEVLLRVDPVTEAWWTSGRDRLPFRHLQLPSEQMPPQRGTRGPGGGGAVPGARPAATLPERPRSILP